MFVSPLPPDEPERLLTLHHLGILDTPPEERFDRLTRLALQLFHVPIALVNLVDAHRQWCKSCQGHIPRESARHLSFCAHTILQDELLVIPDMHAHAHFAQHPWVTAVPHIRFYAGYPLRSPEGYALGTLCVLDHTPRTLEAAQQQALRDLAAVVEGELRATRSLALEQAGARHEERFRLLAENIHQMFWLSSPDMRRMEYVSPQYETIWGRTPESLYERPDSFLEAIHPADQARVRAAQPLKRRGGYQEEYRIFKPDGTLRWVSARAFPIRNEAGEVLYIAGISEDITARKEAEADAEAQLAFARQVMTTMGQGLTVTNREGRFEYVNPAYGRMLGYDPAALIGHSPREMVVPAELPKMDEIWVRRQAGETTTYELRLQRADGSELYALITGVPRLRDGEVIGTIAVITDLTAHRAAEAALEQHYREAEHARTETRAILDSVSEAILLLTPEYRVHTINRRFCDLFGVQPDEILDHPLTELHLFLKQVLEDPAAFRALLATTIAAPRTQFSDLIAQRYPEPRDLALFSTPVESAEGTPLGRLFVFRDVTRERAADRMRGEFVSMVSHELRTPLTAITGFVDLLASGTIGTPDQEQQGLLDIVKHNADRLMRLINDLLDLSQIEAGKITLELVPEDPVPLMRMVVATLHRQIEAKGQTLLVELPATLPRVLVDSGRLTQVLMNLLSNAHKYTPTGGQIIVSGRVAEGQVELAVRDTGVGLSPEAQGKLFTRFFRASDHPMPTEKGTGLGLAISRSLVDLHGGTILVRSALGEGSTFTVALPIAVGP